jgi:hypothetical protein
MDARARRSPARTVGSRPIQACDTPGPKHSLVAGSLRAVRRNRTNVGILERLGRGPATIGELAPAVRAHLNGVKKHVGILEEVDLVVTAKVGRARECQLGPAQLEDATEWIDDYRRTWQRRLDRFGSYVERKDAGR